MPRVLSKFSKILFLFFRRVKASFSRQVRIAEIHADFQLWFFFLIPLWEKPFCVGLWHLAVLGQI